MVNRIVVRVCCGFLAAVYLLCLFYKFHMVLISEIEDFICVCAICISKYIV